MKASTITTVFTVFAIVTLSQAQEIKPTEVKNVMGKVADWQIEHFRDLYSGHSEPHHPLEWTNGALYIGMVKWAAIADDDKYYNWLKEIGDKYEWKLHRRKYHADDHTVGQLYVDLYRKFKNENMIEPTIEQFNYIMLHPAQTSLQWRTPYHQDRWDWCDALFMSPPVWAKLYNITGEKKYLDFMVAEYKATTDFLFDKKENLYYRDETYMGKLDSGTKIFWSRGNGWVFAGLTNILNELDPLSEEYKYFLRIYKKMAQKLLEIQTPEGHWSMSLLGQSFYPTPETSGSSFFIYGLAWGINKGLLPKKEYISAVSNGWQALNKEAVHKDGSIGYAQATGDKPSDGQPVTYDSKPDFEDYTIGAFLLAGSEVYHLAK